MENHEERLQDFRWKECEINDDGRSLQYDHKIFCRWKDGRSMMMGMFTRKDRRFSEVIRPRWVDQGQLEEGDQLEDQLEEGDQLEDQLRSTKIKQDQ